MAELRNKVSQLRLEKELLEWERGQVEENLERSGEMTEPSRRPDLAVHGEDLRVDSEVKFNVPRSPKHQAETTGYFSEAQTVPMGRNVAFTTPPLQQPRVFPVSSTPLDFHEQQIGFKHPMQSPMPGMMSQSPNVTHVKQQRPLLVPDRYDGKLAWRDFQQHFEACKGLNQWNDSEAASYMLASLQGEALRYVSGMSTEVRHSYKELTILLERRFGSAKQAENFLAELRHRRQGPRETLQELGQAIHELAIKAYPEIPANARGRLEKAHYIDAVDSQLIREGIHRARPSTLDEAIQAALETENFEKVEMQRRNERIRAGKFARGLENEDDARLQQMESMFTQRMNDIQHQISEMCMNMSSGVNRPQSSSNEARSSDAQWREERRCYKCGEIGHLIRYCPHNKRNNRRTGNARQPAEGPEGRLGDQQGQQTPNQPTENQQ